jgi:glutathione S-transferase
LGDIPLVLGISRWILLHESFAEKTGPRTPYQNIDAWVKRLETNTNYSIVAENTLNIVK